MATKPKTKINKADDDAAAANAAMARSRVFWDKVREQAEEMLKGRAEGAPIEGLTERERRFAEAYVEVSLDMMKDHGVAHIAYRRAFPLSEATSQGAYSLANAMLQQPRVQEYIGILRHEVSKRQMQPVGRLVTEIERIAYANILDYVRIDEHGEARIDLSNITPSQAAAIQEIIVEEDFEKGKKKTRLKLYDKQKSQEQLARVHGIFQDKLSVSLTPELIDRLIHDMKEKLIAQGVPVEFLDSLLIEGKAEDVTPQEASDG